MSDLLRDRIAWVIATTDKSDIDAGFDFATAKGVAEEIIESLGLSAYTCCDECTFVTIDGHYDTTFE